MSKALKKMGEERYEQELMSGVNALAERLHVRFPENPDEVQHIIDDVKRKSTSRRTDERRKLICNALRNDLSLLECACIRPIECRIDKR